MVFSHFWVLRCSCIFATVSAETMKTWFQDHQLQFQIKQISRRQLTAAILQIGGALTSRRQHFLLLVYTSSEVMLKGINMRITALHFVTQSWCWWEVWAILRSFQPQFDDLFSLLFFSSFHFANPAEVRFQKLKWVRSGRFLFKHVMMSPNYHLHISLYLEPMISIQYFISMLQHAVFIRMFMIVDQPLDVWSGHGHTWSRVAGPSFTLKVKLGRGPSLTRPFEKA